MISNRMYDTARTKLARKNTVGTQLDAKNARIVGAGFLLVLLACTPTPLEIYAEFEESAGVEFEDCGYVSSKPPAEECAIYDELTQTEQDALACLSVAVEGCQPISVDFRLRPPSGGTEIVRLYLEKMPGSECKVVIFSSEGVEDMVRSECTNLEVAPIACKAVEFSGCTEVERIPYKVPTL